MAIKITVKISHPKVGDITVKERVTLSDLMISRKQAEDTYYVNEAVKEFVLNKIVSIDWRFERKGGAR